MEKYTGDIGRPPKLELINQGLDHVFAVLSNLERTLSQIRCGDGPVARGPDQPQSPPVSMADLLKALPETFKGLAERVERANAELKDMVL
jgi:hypothetical protein